jgi:hypothetical protein
MNITNPPVQFERPLRKEQYFMYGEFEFPNHIKAYVDTYSYEYQSISDETRLLDLGFMLLRGYNIKKAISDWLKNHPEISEASIVYNIGQLLITFDDVDEAEILANSESMNLSQMIDYFKPLLLDCYSEVDGKQKFDDNDIANTTRRNQCLFSNGHYLGEVHPNGKLQWTEYKIDKYDWRTIK